MTIDVSRDLCFYLQREEESQTHWFQIKIVQDKGCDWSDLVFDPTPKTNCCGHNSCPICATWCEGMFFQKGVFFLVGQATDTYYVVPAGERPSPKLPCAVGPGPR